MMLLWLAWLAHGVELGEARQQATERASEVEVMRADAEAAEARARVAAGQALPALSGFADVNLGAGYTPFGFERPVPWQAGVGVRGSWSLVAPAQWAAARAARRTARGRSAMLAWTQCQARQDVTLAFVEAQAAATVASRLGQAVTDARQGARGVEELVEAGLRPAVDGARARADAEDIAAREATALGEVAATCARLQGLIGVTIDGRCDVSAVDWSTAEPMESNASHPALVAAREAEAAAKAQVASVAWSALPSIGLTGTGAQYAVPERTGPGWSATISLDIPLTAPTTGLAETSAARADRARAQASLDQQQRDLSVAQVQARARLQAARRTLVARQAGLEAARQAWERVDARFQQGLEDLTTWLLARRARIEAEIAVAQAEAQVGASIASLEGALGVR